MQLFTQQLYRVLHCMHAYIVTVPQWQIFTNNSTFVSANSRPSKKKILDLIPHLAPQWYELGIQLLREDQESHLDVIKSDYGNDNKQCCAQMFWYWLKTNPKANWQQLLDSLISPALELHTVAANIEAMFTGKLRFYPTRPHKYYVSS